MKSKIFARESLIATRERLGRERKKVGYTSGVFDILHPGHVDYLEKARAECDCLIVGVNSDSSVRGNKGELRPINSEESRARVVAALSFVDFVFIFSEKNNNKNIETLKPDLYIKAGDYSKSSLSSAPLVEAYGGKIILIPTLSGYSTTSIINKIAGVKIDEGASAIELPPMEKAPAAFIDRDGTLIEHVEYLHEPEKLKMLPGAIDGLKLFKEAGFRLVVITNQPGIGLGYFTKEQFFIVNRELLRACSKAGVGLDKVYFCPHNEAEKCACRKPGTAMIERAVRELNLDLPASVMIGDIAIDIQLGKNAGCSTIQVGTGIGMQNTSSVAPDYFARNVLEAAQWFIKSKPKNV